MKVKALVGLTAIALGLFAPCVLAEAPATRHMTYVENVENMTSLKVRYVGKPWAPHADGYLEGKGAGHQIAMIPPPAAGDFRVNIEMVLPTKGKRSAITIGYDDQIVLQSGDRAVTLQGRFFRSVDKPIEVTGPEIPAGQTISLSLERKGDVATLKIAGREVYTGPCDPGSVDLLGVDPMDGRVRLISMSAVGLFPEKGEEHFANPFGMQKREIPKTAKDVFAPVIVQEGPTNECAMVKRRDGTLEMYFATKPASDSISVMRSKDGGLTWSAPEIAIPLPGKIYYAVMMAEDSERTLHAAFHIFAEGEGGYRGRLYNIYHTRLAKNGAWEKPQLVIPGYVGSLRGFIELASGRLILAAGLAVPERMDKPAEGVDYGWNDTVIYTSDDKGTTWTKSPDVLKVPLLGEKTTRYGAVEPVIVQLNDGRVWMLIRDRGGRFTQSFSEDGTRWTQPAPTDITTSDSPASFVKLKNGKIVLFANACQNWTNPVSYAMGGREVLQASISADDGKTWSGFRDVLHETLGPGGGDRGAAYPSGVETNDGKICLFSGQGEGKRAVVLFDPKWLEEKIIRDDLGSGPVMWAQYGDKGIRVEPKEAPAMVVIPLKASGISGASWNFPAAIRGELKMRIWIPEGTVSGSLSLTDHFSRMDDKKAAAHSVFLLPLGEKSGLTPGGWRDLVFQWDGSGATVQVDGGARQPLKLLRPTSYGVNYLRVEARSTKDTEAIKISDLSATKR